MRASRADHAAMTQDKWTSLTMLDPFVRSFTKNDLAAFVKGKKTEDMTEVFVSTQGRQGSVSREDVRVVPQGKAKHDVPMTGKAWQGQVEVDESTGTQQIQIAVPCSTAASQSARSWSGSPSANCRQRRRCIGGRDQDDQRSATAPRPDVRHGGHRDCGFECIRAHAAEEYADSRQATEAGVAEATRAFTLLDEVAGPRAPSRPPSA